MSTWVLISNIPPYFGEHAIRGLFKKPSLVSEIRGIYLCSDDCRIGNQAFVQFWHSKDAKRASSTIDGEVLNSTDARAISVAVVWSDKDTLSTVVVDRVPRKTTEQGLFDMFESSGDVIHVFFAPSSSDSARMIESSGSPGSSSLSSVSFSTVSRRRAYVVFRRVEYAINAANKMNGEMVSPDVGREGLRVQLLNADARNLKWKRLTFDYCKCDIPRVFVEAAMKSSSMPRYSGVGSGKSGTSAKKRGHSSVGRSSPSDGGGVGRHSSGRQRHSHRPPRFDAKGPRDRSTAHRHRSGGRSGSGAVGSGRAPGRSAAAGIAPVSALGARGERRRSVELEISQTTDAFEGYAHDDGSRYFSDRVIGSMTTERDWDSARIREREMIAAATSRQIDAIQQAALAAQHQKEQQQRALYYAMIENSRQMESLQRQAMLDVHRRRTEADRLGFDELQAQLVRIQEATVAAGAGAASAEGTSGSGDGSGKASHMAAPMVHAAGVAAARPSSDTVNPSGWVSSRMSQMPVATDGLTGPHFIPFGGSSGDPSEVSSVPRLSGLLAATHATGSGTRGSADSSASSLLSDRSGGSITSALSPSTGPPSIGLHSALLPSDPRMSPGLAAATEAVLLQAGDSCLISPTALLAGPLAGYAGMPHLMPQLGSAMAGSSPMAQRAGALSGVAPLTAASTAVASKPPTVSPSPSSVTGGTGTIRAESSVGSSSSVTDTSGRSAGTVSTACEGMSSVSRPRRLKPSRTQKKIDEEKRRKKEKHSSSSSKTKKKVPIAASAEATVAKDSGEEPEASVVQDVPIYHPSVSADEASEKKRTLEKECRKRLTMFYEKETSLQLAQMFLCLPIKDIESMLSNDIVFLDRARLFHNLLSKQTQSS